MELRAVRRPHDLEALEALFDVVTECDGHAPIGEHKYLDLRGADPDRVTGLVVVRGGDLMAYVAVSPTRDRVTWAIEFAVHPLHRSPGEVSLLVAAALEQVEASGGRRARVWAFQPNMVEALEAAGFVPERELRQLRRPLPIGSLPEFPPEVDVRPFRTARDEEAWLAVNNAAFAGHPENGSWTLEVLADRQRQPWFDQDLFRMAWEGEKLLGFCWTKLHDGGVGEIYVIAVAPHAAGRGLGRALVLEGLRVLHEEAGAMGAMLYVDADNHPALGLYDRLGFQLDHVDRSFVRDL